MSRLVSTRSNKSEDARRDFDGFDVNEELKLYRQACREGSWRKAAELMSNIDEFLTRGGVPPASWVSARGQGHGKHPLPNNRRTKLFYDETPETYEYVEVKPVGDN